MGMTLMTPASDFRESLRQLSELRIENGELRRELVKVRQEAAEERQKVVALERGVLTLREILSPLHQALGMVFGEIDGMGVGTASGSAPVPAKNAAAWEQWKQRLGGATARAIDALMVHGEMNQTQLRILLGCATRTVTNVVAALNQAKLIDKRDGKIRLKEL
jgi:hypothetical protein